MPSYSYICAEGHTQTVLCRFANKPDVLRCETCGGDARYSLTATHGLHVMEPKNAVKGRAGKGFVWRDIACKACGHKTVEDIDLDEQGKIPADLAFDCEKCGGPTEIRGMHFIDRESERFPYFDRGLGREIRSRAHRKQVCQELGVEPAEEGVDRTMDLAFRKRREEAERDERVYQDMVDRMEHAPAFASWRKHQRRQRAT